MTPAQRAIREAAELFLPPPDITITEWAEDNRILSAENCALPGPYRVNVTPFLKEIIDCVTDRKVERLVCQKSAQVAWTDGVVNNAVGYYVDKDPAPMLILFPTENMAQRYSKEKLTPMIRDTECLSEKVADPKSRDSGNTILSKNFKGGHLELVGSNAPSKLASSPIRIIIVEEPDRCSKNSGGEGNSLKLAFERGKTFHNRKILLGGSPTIKGASEIEREMEMSDQRHFHIPCPHCNEFQTLTWSMVVWEKGEDDHPVFGRHKPETAKFKCVHCEKEFDNSQKNKQLSKGKWIAEREFNGTAGFYINELYSPFPKATLTDVVEKFLEADKSLKQGDPELMTTFTNTSLGEAFEERGETADPDDLFHRREHYKSQVPDGVSVLTAFIDVQDDRFEWEVTGWGEHEEQWSIDYQRLYGNLSKPEIWKILAEKLRQTYKRDDGALFDIKLIGIDSGGHYTDEVYEFSKKYGVRWIIPTKGWSESGKPIATFPKKRNKKGVYLTMVGTDTAKEIIYRRYEIKDTGPGYCHHPVSEDFDEEYFKQATAEEKVKKYRYGNPYYVWDAKKRRNEVLDCKVGNLAMIRILTQNFGFKLKKIEKKEPEAKPYVPNKGGFVNNWRS